MALYIPNNFDFDSTCVVVLNNYTARIYDRDSSTGSITSDYTDVALDNHYLEYYGVESSDALPSDSACYPVSSLTHNIIERTDFTDIFLVGTGLFLITFIAFYKLLTYMFRGWF